MTGENGLLAELPEGFWSRVASARDRALLLDYDGTLAAFCERRQDARPSARVLDLLRRIAVSRAARLAIVSGRPIRELRNLLGALPVILVGEHGWEALRPGAGLQRIPVPKSGRDGLRGAIEDAEREGWGGAVERKRACIVLHTRGLPGRLAERIVRSARSVWSRRATRHGLRMDAIDGGLELRVPGRDKGAVVREIAATLPTGALIVCVGDDRTDEDAFRAVADGGFGLRVGSPRESLAAGRLPSVAAVEVFLEKWTTTFPPRPGAMKREGS